MIVKTIPPDFLLLLGEKGYKVIQGRLTYLIAPLVTGSNSVSAIASQLKGELTREEVEMGLFLLEGENVFSQTRDALLDLLTPDLSAGQQMARKEIRVLTTGNVSSLPFVKALKNLGIRTTQKPGQTLWIVDDYLRDELEEFNHEAIRKKWPWMLVKPNGTIPWIGPVFHPPDSPCWLCLASRIRKNRQPEFFDSKVQASFPLIPIIGEVTANLTALHVFRWVLSREKKELITIDTVAMTMQKHTVVRLEDCPACGNKRSQASPKPIVLKSCKKLFLYDSGHRSATSEDTFEKYRYHISGITGIVDQIEPLSRDSNGITPAFVAGHLFVPALKKQLSAGKGITQQQARTGALCEALERYSGVFRGNEYRIIASYRELGDLAIHPNACLNYSERQFGSKFPVPFQEEKPIEWSPVWSLTHERFRYVPTACCYYGYELPEDHWFCQADSNGNAAGNTIEEAILHGFLELIERDSAAIWWFNRIPRPGVDVESFAHPFIHSMQAACKEMKRKLWVLDITADFTIPVFAAVSTLPGSRNELLFGFGCHLDPVLALMRALSELNQFWGGIKRRGSLKANHMSFVKPARHLTQKKCCDYSSTGSKDIKQDVLKCVSIARRKGLETFVLDQTRKDVGMPVVKVIVPGLRQLWPRFAKGRLYDVPVSMGWLKKPLSENELNSDSIVL